MIGIENASQKRTCRTIFFAASGVMRSPCETTKPTVPPSTLPNAVQTPSGEPTQISESASAMYLGSLSG